jgi:hypothetical protein
MDKMFIFINMEILLKTFDNKYSVSDEGKVFSLKGKKKELKGKITRSGYRIVLISHNGKRKYLLVHRLVASFFVPNSENKKTVNHIDGNKLNNNKLNLEWATYVENLIHARDTGLLSTCKITMEIANQIRNDIGTNRSLAVKYNLGKSQIQLIKTNQRWRS